MTQSALSVVMLGATGAVGSHVARRLVSMPEVEALTLLGRRPLAGLSGDHVNHRVVDVLEAASYEAFLPGHRPPSAHWVWANRRRSAGATS